MHMTLGMNDITPFRDNIARLKVAITISNKVIDT